MNAVLSLLVAVLPAQAAAPARAVDGGSPKMVATFDEVMRKLARSHHAEGLKHFRRKDYPAALRAFQKAYDLDRRNAQITNDLAYLYQLLGNHQEAERYYRETLLVDPNRAIAHLNLSDLLNQKGASLTRLDEAAQHLTRARELLGNRAGLILRQARLASARGRFEQAQRYYREYLARRKPTDAIRLEIGDFYSGFGRAEEALSWYRQVTDPGELGRQAAKRIWRINVEREARRFGWIRRPEQIPREARSLASKGRLLYNQGQLRSAERLLRKAIRMAPQFAMARADLGDVLRRLRRPRDAELAYLRALALEQGNAEIYHRIGELYLAMRGRASESALFLSRALQVRPDWSHLHLRVALAYRRAGDLPRALRHVERFLSEPGRVKPSDRRRAIALKRALEQLLPSRPARPARSGEPASSRALIGTLNRARAFLAQGQPQAAMAELRRLADADRGPAVLNLEGRILFAAGRSDEAVSTFRASLKKKEAQSEVHEQLGAILSQQGKEPAARRHLRRAQVLGNLSATYHLARLEAGSGTDGALSWLADFANVGRLISARGLLEGFLARGSTSIYREEAEALLARVNGRLRAVVAAGVSIGLLALLSGWLIWVRLWGGGDLAKLLRRHPEAGPQVQRVLSAIRHEVLKHNTMVLTGLAEAVAGGEDASEMAQYCRESLFGGPDGGAAKRLRGYVEQLRQIGRSHGMRLNLRRRDPAVSALLRGFGILARIDPQLSRIDALSGRARARLTRRLRTAARLLNTQGYEAVRVLLDRLRVLEVDEGLLTAVYQRTSREPAFAGVDLSPLGIDLALSLPCRVLIPRFAFEDILANLIRNAIQSSLRHGQEVVTIGLAAREEIDPITGIARVVFLIRDRSPQVLTTEMLRGRYIEEGLGLTADLVSRYEGTLDVVAEEGPWTKAVVVKLPMADAEAHARSPEGGT